MRRSIVWFKTDLRLHDNETLVQAMDQSDEIIPVYCLDDAHFAPAAFGLKKTGSFRAKFLLESIIDLDKNLRVLGSGLVVVKGNPASQISALAKHYAVDKVFAKDEVADEEIKTQQHVETELNKINCTLHTCSSGTLYQITDLPFTVQDIPDVFTDFRKKVEKQATVRSAIPKPSHIYSPVIEPIRLPALRDLGLNDIEADSRAAWMFKGGETEAWKRLCHYFFESKSLSNYKESRNGLVGADYSSKFSAWLAQGCFSARSIYWQVKKYEQQVVTNHSTYWLIFELLWRDYFRFMMKKYGNAFFSKQGIRKSKQNFQTYNQEVFHQWMNGETGEDFVDANMRELKLTGYMSNRGRQNVASFLCYNLKQDWRCGAMYFEQQLIDYDVCSNWGNWAYIAGVGNDPRSQRVFNIVKQAEAYDGNKTYRNKWLTNN